MQIGINKYQNIQNSTSSTFKGKFAAKLAGNDIDKNSMTLIRLFEEKFIKYKIDKLQNAKFSKNMEVCEIEKFLKSKGVNVRFHNNLELANYVKNCIEILVERKIPLIKNILLMPKILGRNSCAIWSLTFSQKDAPIILSQKAYKKRNKEVGFFSSKSPMHTFFHEMGHWLHFNSKFNINKNFYNWQLYADERLIKETVSTRASQLQDGSELCAEVFAGAMAGKKYPPSILDLARIFGFKLKYLKNN